MLHRSAVPLSAAIHVAKREHSRAAAGSHFVLRRSGALLPRFLRRSTAYDATLLPILSKRSLPSERAALSSLPTRLENRGVNQATPILKLLISRISLSTTNMLRPSRLVTYMENYGYDRAIIHSCGFFFSASISTKKFARSNTGISRSPRLFHEIDHYRATVAFFFCLAPAISRLLISCNKSALRKLLVTTSTRILLSFYM